MIFMEQIEDGCGFGGKIEIQNNITMLNQFHTRDGII